jgi:hypothetical protein
MTTADGALTVLVHGAAKAGKSQLSVTTPEPRLYLDAESAARFLPIKPIKWNPHTQAPPEYDGTWDTCVVDTLDWETVQAVYQWLNSGQHPFESLIIDSISELQARVIERVGGREQLTMTQWGTTFRQLSGLCRDIRDLTSPAKAKPLKAIVVVAMTKFDSNANKWKPYVAGQLGTVLPYMWDCVTYIYVERVPDPTTGEMVEIRRLLTQGTHDIEAGERVGGKLPRVIDNPNIEEMRRTIFGTPLPAPEV